MNEYRRKNPELNVVVSDLRSACTDRDSALVRAHVGELFECLQQLDLENLDSGPSRRTLAAGWLLGKCAENLRELEWPMTDKWDQVAQTADLAERCAVQLREPVEV